MLGRLLDARQEELLARERSCLGDLRATLARLGAARDDQATLERAVRQLDELFLVVVVGEFNAGKSTFIDALLGQELLERGVTPTTTRIQRLAWGPAGERRAGAEGLVELTAPLELLKSLHIVDTPGTNALERRHETLTREFIPRSDVVLFVTSADRPFTESERVFMEHIRAWGKKLVLILNKIDFLAAEDEVEKIVEFLADRARQVLGFAPEIFPVSAKAALDAKVAGDPEGLATSRFEALERYLVETLDERERLRLKLANPLAVGLNLAERYLHAVEERATLLHDDFAALKDIDAQLALYREDLGREFRFRLTDVENLLQAFEQRGLEFCDDTMRLPRLFDLLNKAKLKAEFQRKVIADAPREVERKVDEIIDWMVASELRQWRAIGERLERRKAVHAERLVGQIGSFEYDRNRLLETVGRAAHRTIESYDREAEASRMAEAVQTAVAGTAIVEVGAIGLGTVVTLIATTQLADVTGILAAGAVAVLGLFVLPARRRVAKEELSTKIAALGEQLMRALTEQFQREVEKSLHRIEEAISPYTRFVRGERQELEAASAELGALGERARGLLAEVESLAGPAG